jgi:hypothetical protein
MLKEFIRPAILPPLDAAFQPAALSNRWFRSLAAREGVPFVIGLERKGNELSRYETRVFPEGHPLFSQNYTHIERLVKFLLWQHGSYRIYLGGSKALGEYIRDLYSHNGERALTLPLWETRFMRLDLRCAYVLRKKFRRKKRAAKCSVVIGMVAG